jgi:cobalt-zinc-cadmium efflux system outer membrane protein
MRFTTLALAGALVMCPWLVHAQAGAAVAPPPTAPSTGDTAASAVLPLSLDEALRLAASHHPALRLKQAQLAAAEGARSEASAPLFNNPQLSLESTRRSVPGERRAEWAAGLTQTLELAGQQGHRRRASEAALEALRAEIDDARQQVRAEVTQAYNRLLAAQQRAALETEARQLFESTATAVEKRRAAGEDTRLDANVALVEAERARNQQALANEQLLEARAALADALQWPAGNWPQAGGDLADGALQRYTLDALLSAIDAQPRLRVLSARQDGAQARLRLEQAGRYPDVSLGLSVGREGPGDARERLTTLSVSVPLPLFKQNAAGIGQASSELSQAQIERETTARALRAQAHTLWTRLQSLQARVQRLQDAVLPALAHNQQLSLKSQRAGQIGLLELIVVNRQALDARRDLIDALADTQAARTALEALVGWPQQGTQP